jgi:hypothetical protein
MNELTTVDNIITAFKLRLGDDYSLSFDEMNGMFQLMNNVTSKVLLRFSYDSEVRKFDYYSLIDNTFFEQAESIFTQFKELNNCQKISNALFENELSKVILIEPIIFGSSFLEGAKITGKRITFKPSFYYKNAWNMIFIETGYVITPEFKIKPIIDMVINFRGFGKARFFVDEDSGEIVSILDETEYHLNTDRPALSKIAAKTQSSAYYMKATAIENIEGSSHLRQYVDNFIGEVAAKLYHFYIETNGIHTISEATGTLDDFKVLEMLKV